MADVDQVITEDDFDEWFWGYITGPLNAAPARWDGKSRPAREFALERILNYLRTRGVTFEQLADPTQLRTAVRYGAAEHIFQGMMSSGQEGDVFAKQRALMAANFQDELQGLVVDTVDSDTPVSTFTVPVRRG